MNVPGLVDLQVNGYSGVDFSDENLAEDQCVGACRRMLRAGTTAFLATLITSPVEVYERNLTLIAKVAGLDEFRGRLLGVHLEGPFISSEDGARGAHNAEWTRRPDPALLEKLIDWGRGRIRLITIAAELPGAYELTRYAVRSGIAVALGHQMATGPDLEYLAQAGAVALTHLGNGVPASLDRHYNPVWAGLANDNLMATLITDGHHLPVAVIRSFIRAKGPERCVIISDATSLAGAPAGRYTTWGQSVVLEENGKLYNPLTGYLAGSAATMLQCVNHLASLNLVRPTELVAMVFDNPLKLIGLGPEDVASNENVVFDGRSQTFCLRDE